MKKVASRLTTNAGGGGVQQIYIKDILKSSVKFTLEFRIRIKLMRNRKAGHDKLSASPLVFLLLQLFSRQTLALDLPVRLIVAPSILSNMMQELGSSTPQLIWTHMKFKFQQ